VEHALGPEQFQNALLELVADLAHRLNRLPARVGDRPIKAFHTGNDRAGLATAHGDEVVRSVRQLRRKQLGLDAAQVNPGLTHRFHHLHIEVRTGLGSGGNNFQAVTGQVPRPSGSNLRPARIVHACEYDFLHDASFPSDSAINPAAIVLAKFTPLLPMTPRSSRVAPSRLSITVASAPAPIRIGRAEGGTT